MHRLMGIDLGMPTLLEMPSVLDCAALCGELGLQFVELNMNLPEYQMHCIDERPIEQALSQHGIYCTLHLDENFNICDFNEDVRAAYRKTALSAIALAKRQQIPIINMHLHEGVHFKLPGEKVYLFDRYADHYAASLLAFRDACEAAIGDSGILICIENTDGFAPFAQRGIELLLDSEAFGLTLDIGHCHCAGDVDRPFYQAHEDRLRHMHIHDANDRTCHLPFGEGVLDIEASLQLARDRGCRAVLEVKSLAGLRQTVKAL